MSLEIHVRESSRKTEKFRKRVEREAGARIDLSRGISTLRERQVKVLSVGWGDLKASVLSNKFKEILGECSKVFADPVSLLLLPPQQAVKRVEDAKIYGEVKLYSFDREKGEIGERIVGIDSLKNLSDFTSSQMATLQSRVLELLLVKTGGSAFVFRDAVKYMEEERLAPLLTNIKGVDYEYGTLGAHKIAGLPPFRILVYGEPAIGKTELLTFLTASAIGQGYGAVFLDTEGGFRVERVCTFLKNRFGVENPEAVVGERLIVSKEFVNIEGFFDAIGSGQLTSLMRKTVEKAPIRALFLDSIASLPRREFTGVDIGQRDQLDKARKIMLQIFGIKAMEGVLGLTIFTTTHIYTDISGYGARRYRIWGGTSLGHNVSGEWFMREATEKDLSRISKAVALPKSWLKEKKKSLRVLEIRKGGPAMSVYLYYEKDKGFYDIRDLRR